MLSGSSELPTYPPLTNATNFAQPFSFPDVVGLLTTPGHDISTVADMHLNDASVPSYWEKYVRLDTGIKHHVVHHMDGHFGPLLLESVPDDLHDCVGLQLPRELIYYIYRGMIRPRVLDWLTKGETLVLAPFEGGDSIEYQNLVKNQLKPLREQALCLIAYDLHHYYQQKEITTKFWFGAANDQKFNLRDMTAPRASQFKWYVKDVLIQPRREQLAAVRTWAVVF